MPGALCPQMTLTAFRPAFASSPPSPDSGCSGVRRRQGGSGLGRSPAGHPGQPGESGGAYPRAVGTVALAEDHHPVVLDEAAQAAPQLLAGLGWRPGGPGERAGAAFGGRRRPGDAADAAQGAVGGRARGPPLRLLQGRALAARWAGPGLLGSGDAGSDRGGG